MTLLNLNKNFSLNNMFKSEYLLKPLVSIVVLQMILMPVAPVLAEELQNLNSFSFEGATSTPVEAINIVDSIATSTENVTILNIDSIPTPTTLFGTLLIDNTNNFSTSSATASLNLDTTSSTSNVLLVNTSTVNDNLVTQQPLANQINILSRDIFLLDELVPLKIRNIDEEQELADSILAIPKIVSLEENIKIPDSLFKVVDEYKDEADLGNGKKVMKIFPTPRQTYVDNGIQKVRPSGWNKFDQDPVSKIRTPKSGGYNFGVSLTENEKVDITVGDLEHRNIGRQTNLVVPGKTSFRQFTDKDNYVVSSFKDVYKDVDVNFVDKQTFRTKEIIINKPPTGINADELIFWEEYKIPTNAVVAINDKEINGSNDNVQGEVSISSPTGEKFIISGAIIYDGSFQDVNDIESRAEAVKEIVEVDHINNKVRIGLKVSADYLLSVDRIYPVTIDPIYTTCMQGGGSNIGTCNINEVYLRYMTSNTYLAYQSKAYLLLGYSSDVNGPATRQPVIGFMQSNGSYFPNLTSYGTLTNAKLYLTRSENAGLGSTSGSGIATHVMKVTNSWDKNTVIYGHPGIQNDGIHNYLSDISSSYTSISRSIASGQSVSWDVTSAVQDWISGSSNYGLYIEPTPHWTSGVTPGWPLKNFWFRSSVWGSSGGPYLELNFTPPVPSKPDLIDNGTTISPKSVTAGQSLTINFKIKNNSSAASVGQSSVLKYYFNPSSNCYGTSNPAGQITIPTLNANGTNNQSTGYTVPSGISGNYCFYYVIDANNNVDESNESNNTLYANITVALAVVDPLEPNNTSASAYNIGSNTSYVNNSLELTSSDQDWFKFIYNSKTYYFKVRGYTSGSIGKYGINFSRSGSAVTIETTSVGGSSVDTYLELYDSNGSTILTSDDDNGAGAFSLINNYSLVVDVYDFVASNFAITDTKLRYSGLSDTITMNGYVQNTGNVGGSVNYILRLKNLADGSVYNLNSLSPSSLNLSAGYSQYVNLTGSVPNGMPFYGNYSVEVILDSNFAITESNENNNTANSTNNVSVQQYYTGGGGGSGSSSDADADTFTNVEETYVGTNVNGTQSLSPFDNNNKQKTAILSDKPKNMVAASVSYSDAMSIVKTSLFADNSSYSADPVNIRTGAFEFNQTDFALVGRGLPINFNHVYNSKISDIGGRLGNGWSDSYNIFYYQDPTTKNILLYLGGSLTTLFTTNDGGAIFNAPHGEFEILTKESGNLVYKTLNGIKYIFSLQLTNNLGILKQIVDTKGNTVTLNYNTVRDIPLISSIVDASGRQISFVYPVSTDPLWDKIQEVRESVGGTSKLIAKYTYDSNENLITDHQESNYSVEVTKNIDRTFTYDVSGRMLTYTDTRSTTLYNEYDGTGRITKQYEKNPRLGSNDKRLIYELIYTDVADPGVAGSAHCTLVKNYRDASNHYDEYACYNSNELKIYSKKGNNIEQWQYDGSGMIIKYTDALGNVTNYTYDVNRRLISQTPADSIDWHTVVTFEYENNFNRLTKKTETVTALTGKTPPSPRVTNFTIDSATGNLTTVQYPDGLSESFQYDAFGNVKKYTNKNNAVTDYVYDSNGNYVSSETVTVTQADNTAQTIKKQYGYDGYGHRTSYVDPNGKTYSYGYDTRGNMRFETDPLANSKYYKYDQEDHRILETDALGHDTQYVYDTDINASLLSVTKVSGSGNIVNSRQYDYVGNVIKEIDGNGNNKNYTYTAENWLLSTADAKRTITNDYYVNGWLKKQTDSEGRRTDYFYDTRGNKTETRAYYDATNFISNKFVYDGFNRVISQTDGKNNVTTFAYDVMGRLITSTDAKGGVTTYFYDAVGNKIGERSPRASADATLRNSYGYSTAYFYDNANRLIKKVNANDKATLYIYDANGNIIKSIENQNSDGTSATHVSQATYFDNNWKKTETDAEGGIVQYAYEKVGTIKTKTSAAGLVTSYTYDDFNRLTKETDNAGLATIYQYDANNNKTAVTYSDNTKTQYTYSPLNQILTVKDALNGTRQFEYDGANNKIKETNKLGKVTNFVYDKLNRLSQEANPAGTATNYTYDNNSNRTAEIVGAKTTAYEYDELNRNTKIIYPGNKSESVTYDTNGNIATKTDGKGQKITYSYDKLNRQTTKLLPGGFAVQYVYDNWSNLTNLTDESGTTVYIYDKLNRNTNETKTLVGLTGKNYTVVRAYNADSQMSALTDSANRKFDYAYNTRGLLDNVKYGATTLSKYSYSNFGKPNLVEYGNGAKTNLIYDSLNRVTNIATNSGTTTLFSQKYSYDAQSNRITMNDGSNSTTTYNYDDLEQLINVNININGTNSVLGYSYDVYGNRTVQTNPLSTANYTYTAGTNELSTVTYNNRLSVASTFDTNGSLTKETYAKLGKADKDITYTWDNQNRLAQINYHYTNRPAFMPAVPDNTLNFTYDDFGNRTKKQTNSGTLTYYVNSGNVVLNEISSTGTTTKSMVYGLSSIAEIDQNNVVTYIHQDTLGSTVLTTNQSGGTVTKYEYDPFGQLIGQDGFTNTNYLYTGQEYDQESDLYYYNARYYNPRLGRFITRDPYLGRDGDTLSRNGYTYVKNNPLKYVDPSGEVEEQSVYDKVVNNDYVQGVGGFVVGASQGLWSTVKTVGNAIVNPIDTIVDIGKGVKDIAVNTYDGSKLIYNEISNKGVGGFIDDVGEGIKYSAKNTYNDLLNKTPYEQGKMIGFITEKVAEVIVLKKAASNINSNSYLRIGEGYTQKGAIAKEFRIAIGGKKAWIHAHIHAGNLFTPSKWVQKFFGFKKYN